MSEPARKHKAFKVSYINSENVLVKETINCMTALNARVRSLKQGRINKLEIERLHKIPVLVSECCQEEVHLIDVIPNRYACDKCDKETKLVPKQ